MRAEEVRGAIRETGLVAILRLREAEAFLTCAEALVEAGVRALEVTMTTQGALEALVSVRPRLPQGVAVGVGTVLDAETARAALLAGAEFLVSPTLSTEVIALARRYGVPVIPGAFTPTEILHAWEAGADFVKVFPAVAGGPDYIRALRGPLPQIPLVPTGGVELENVGEFIRAGAAAVGVGSSLLTPEALADPEVLLRRARAFLEAIRAART